MVVNEKYQQRRANLAVARALKYAHYEKEAVDPLLLTNLLPDLVLVISGYIPITYSRFEEYLMCYKRRHKIPLRFVQQSLRASNMPCHRYLRLPYVFVLDGCNRAGCRRNHFQCHCTQPVDNAFYQNFKL